MPGAEPAGKRLAVDARQLALEPNLQIPRRHRRPLLRRLDQAHRSALADHVRRNARMGLCVMISESWYYATHAFASISSPPAAASACAVNSSTSLDRPGRVDSHCRRQDRPPLSRRRGGPTLPRCDRTPIRGRNRQPGGSHRDRRAVRAAGRAGKGNSAGLRPEVRAASLGRFGLVGSGSLSAAGRDVGRSIRLGFLGAWQFRWEGPLMSIGFSWISLDSLVRI